MEEITVLLDDFVTSQQFPIFEKIMEYIEKNKMISLLSAESDKELRESQIAVNIYHKLPQLLKTIHQNRINDIKNKSTES